VDPENHRFQSDFLYLAGRRKYLCQTGLSNAGECIIVFEKADPADAG
jgi:hypothetical protein